MKLNSREDLFRTGRWIITITAVLASTGAQATQSSDASAPSATVQKRPYSLYLEILGKGGAWGWGGDVCINSRWALGAAGSFQQWKTQRVWSVSPYVTSYLFPQEKHRWFFQVGPQLVQIDTRSLAPEWQGNQTSGIGAQFSTGYEYRNIFLFRFFAMGLAGKQGVAPWMGFDIGCTF